MDNLFRKTYETYFTSVMESSTEAFYDLNLDFRRVCDYLYSDFSKEVDIDASIPGNSSNVRIWLDGFNIFRTKKKNLATLYANYVTSYQLETNQNIDKKEYHFDILKSHIKECYILGCDFTKIEE